MKANELKDYQKVAVDFLRTQYPHIDLDLVLENHVDEIVESDIVTPSKKRGMYQRKKENDQIVKRIWVYTEATKDTPWSAYSRASAHLMHPKGGLAIDNQQHLTLVFIHEFTHAIQDYEGIQPNEVDTTRNEIEYMRINMPDEYLQLVPSQHRPPYRTGQRVILEGTGKIVDGKLMRIKNTIWFPNAHSWRFYIVDEATQGEQMKDVIWENDFAEAVSKVFKPVKKKDTTKPKQAKKKATKKVEEKEPTAEEVAMDLLTGKQK